MTNLKAYANFDGQKIYSQPIGTIHRDSADYSVSDAVMGKTTVNIILPGTANPSPTLEVILDTSGVSGPDKGRPVDNKLTIYTTSTLTFQPARPFSIEVYPVELGGLCAP